MGGRNQKVAARENRGKVRGGGAFFFNPQKRGKSFGRDKKAKKPLGGNGRGGGPQGNHLISLMERYLQKNGIKKRAKKR